VLYLLVMREPYSATFSFVLFVLTTLLFLAFFIYVEITFSIIYHAVVAIIPIMIAAYMWGRTAGVLTGFGFGIAVTFLVYRFSPAVLQEDGIWIFFTGTLAYMLIGWAVGYLSTISTNLRREVERRRSVQEELTGVLQDRELLLSEIHHRVKNNLNVIKGIIQLELESAPPDARTFLAEIDNRIGSVSVIHEKLYRSGDFRSVDMKDYVESIVGDVERSFSRLGNAGSVTVNAKPVTLPSAQALPVGMILVELVTNAFKYGIRPDHDDTIITTLESDAGSCVFSVSNTGNPFPPTVNTQTPDTLGLRIVRSLTAQLHGTMKLETAQTNGRPVTTFTIRYALVSAADGPVSG